MFTGRYRVPQKTCFSTHKCYIWPQRDPGDPNSLNNPANGLNSGCHILGSLLEPFSPPEIINRRRQKRHKLAILGPKFAILGLKCHIGPWPAISTPNGLKRAASSRGLNMTRHKIWPKMPKKYYLLPKNLVSGRFWHPPGEIFWGLNGPKQPPLDLPCHVQPILSLPWPNLNWGCWSY